MKVVYTDDGGKLYVKNEAQDFHSKYGVLKKSQLEKKRAKTNKGVSVSIFDACFIDKFEKIKRGAQIITLKDTGAIIANTGINKESVVIDAGSGSGALACALAGIVKKVYTYDNRPEHIKVVKENIEFFGLKNIEVKLKDVYEGFPVKNADLITLDLKEPWKCIGHAYDALKLGGFLVAYCPNISQAQEFVNANNKFLLIKVIEVMERPWVIKEKIARPDYTPLGHTGFLTFMRKIK
jgi:tRNA (adenine57-N1/adenine58-N1)-methyltransferase